MLLFTDSITEGMQFRPDEEEQRHLYALRPRIGDIVTVSDGKSFKADGRITAADKKGFVITAGIPVPIENAPLPLTMFLALLKGDRLETAVQKCTELGITKIVIYESANCVAKADGKESSKLLRCRKVAKLAAMQCGTPLLPDIDGIISFEEAIRLLAADNGLFFYEKSSLLLSEYLKNSVGVINRNLSFMTGPEGGYTAEEAETVRKAGLPALSLGKLILRAETAPVCVASVVRAFRGEI